MSLAYTILELDRHVNSTTIRSQITQIPELVTEVCDGRTNTLTKVQKYPEYNHVFRSLTNGGIVGLWISLFNTWKTFVDSPYDALLIMEDDVLPVEDFESKLTNAIAELPSDWDMFTVGYRDIYLNFYDNSFNIEGKNLICKMFQTGDSWGVIYRKKFVIDMLEIAKNDSRWFFGIPDTAIFSFGVDNNYNLFSILPSVGTLLTHNPDPSLSTLNNSPNFVWD